MPDEPATFKPKAIIIACGDAGLVLDDISWRKWGARKAVGTGTAVSKTCNPSCAEGGVKRYPVRIRLGKRRGCPSGPKLQFRRVNYTFTDKKPSSLRRKEHSPRFCGN